MRSSPAFDEQFDEAPELTLRHLWEIVKQRRRIIYRATAVAFLIALSVGLFATRKYQAKGEIEIQKDSAGALGLDAMMGSGNAAASDALDANVTLQTEAQIMESQNLALTVIDRLHLADAADFAPHFNPIGWAMGFITPAGPPDPVGAKALGDSPRKRDRLFKVFQSNTKVVPVAGTRLVDISYTSTDPKVAAQVVNQLIESLVDYNFQTRYAATSQTSEWLGKQLADLRSNSDDLQKQVADLQRSSGVFTFGGEDLAGKGTAYSTVLDQLQQTSVSYTQAQSNRIIRGAVYEAAKSGNPEALATLANSGLGGSQSPGVGTSILLLQALRTQESAQKAQISEMAVKFGPAYTRLDEMQANLESIQTSIRDEQGRLEAQAKSDYTIAQQVEDHTRAVFDDQKKSAEVVNDKAIQYQMVRQEADQSRELYSRLQSRLKEAGVLEGLHSSNISVVDPGRIPAKPSSPNPLLLLAGVLFCGPFVGLGCVFGLEIMDGTVHIPAVVRARFGPAYLGTLPFESLKVDRRSAAKRGGSAADRRIGAKQGADGSVLKVDRRVASKQGAYGSEILALERPNSAYSEALRSVRTALLLPGTGEPPQVVLITSTATREGKSTTAANLAVQVAQQGKRVLLVDADLRRGTLRLVSGPTDSDGLSKLLESDLTADSIVAHAIPDVDGLSFLPAGPYPSHPSEMLGSVRMQRLVEVWRKSFDFIILDATAVLPVTDSVVLAPLADQVLLVARFGVTLAEDLERSYRLLQARAPRTGIGVIVNAVKNANPNHYTNLPVANMSTSNQKGLPTCIGQ